MVGCGLAMLALAWSGSYLNIARRMDRSRLLLWPTFLGFPLSFIATLTGWFTAEVGRQPWVVYGVLRTLAAVTPFLSARAATISLLVFCAIYLFIFTFVTLYIYRLLRTGPVGHMASAPTAAVPNRPMSSVERRPAPSFDRQLAGD
jgi:cytochrome bd ubiquinol oxidase subunit I